MRKRLSRLVLGTLGLGAGAYAVLRQRSRPVPDHPFLDIARPIVMAHRGGQGLWPPNTLYAFEQAVALGVSPGATLFQAKVIFSFSMARSAMILEARSSSRR